MISSDNRLSNLMALCATHHGVMHKKYVVKHKKDMIGRRLSSKVVKRNTKKKTPKKRTPQNPFNLKIPKLDFRI